MKVVVVGRNKNYFEKAIGKEKRLTLNEANPDIVIAFGGEGTFLYSEMIYPGIPKLLVYHSSKCRNCRNHGYKKIIKRLAYKKFKTLNFIKIEGSVNGKKLVGMNEVNVHYQPPCALRFDVYINNKSVVRECIGDGLVVSTPYGSSGYFYSITRKIFNKGLGIAFNNPVKPVKTRIIPENSVIKVKVVRGPGVICVDANKKTISLRAGDTITIQKNVQRAKILQFGKDRKVKI